MGASGTVQPADHGPRLWSLNSVSTPTFFPWFTTSNTICPTHGQNHSASVGGWGVVWAGEDSCFHLFLRAVSPAQPGPRAAAKGQSSTFLLLAGRLASSQFQSHSRLPIADHLTVFEVFVLILRLAGSFRFSLLCSVIGTWRTVPKTRPIVPAGRSSPVHQRGAYYRTGFR